MKYFVAVYVTLFTAMAFATDAGVAKDGGTPDAGVSRDAGVDAGTDGGKKSATFLLNAPSENAMRVQVLWDQIQDKIKQANTPDFNLKAMYVAPQGDSAVVVFQDGQLETCVFFVYSKGEWNNAPRLMLRMNIQ